MVAHVALTKYGRVKTAQSELCSGLEWKAGFLNWCESGPWHNALGARPKCRSGHPLDYSFTLPYFCPGFSVDAYVNNKGHLRCWNFYLGTRKWSGMFEIWNSRLVFFSPADLFWLYFLMDLEPLNCTAAQVKGSHWLNVCSLYLGDKLHVVKWKSASH